MKNQKGTERADLRNDRKLKVYHLLNKPYLSKISMTEDDDIELGAVCLLHNLQDPWSSLQIMCNSNSTIKWKQSGH